MKKINIITFCSSVFIYLCGVSITMLHGEFLIFDLSTVEIGCYIIATLLLILSIIIFIVDNKLYFGIKYGIAYLKIKNSLERQLLEAGVIDSCNAPKIDLKFSRDLSSGELRIRNSIYLDKKLEKKIISAGLLNYIVDEQYKSKDLNEHIYKLINTDISYKKYYEKYEDFIMDVENIGNYRMMIDSRYKNVLLNHMLVTGQTGSGKSYFVNGLILQLMNKKISYKFYIADPKMSGMCHIGKKICEDNCATEFDEIRKLISKFVEEMDIRKNVMGEYGSLAINKDYRYFKLEPMILIIDELATFMYELECKEKKVRDEINANLAKITLQGRQLGCFLWGIMQKSDSKLISTVIRENMPIKIVLGNSESQTYTTSFGTGVDIPVYDFDIGEGVFIAPVIAKNPKIIFTPEYAFELIDYI